jgi:uncharacterized SAM-binding protein YcdF (DUF218 family)
MPGSRNRRRGRATINEYSHRRVRFVRRLLFAILVLAIVVVAVRLSMPYMARRLVRTDPLRHSDLIVVLGSYRLERTLEAGMLVHEGWARRILLLRGPDLIRDSLRRQLEIRVPVYADIQRDALVQMGVASSAIVDSPGVQDSTRSEAVAVAGYVRQNGYRSVIVVTSPYHTARARRLLVNAAGGSFQVTMRADRFETIDPDSWWRRFPDRSDVTLEYLKIVYGWSQIFN